MNTQQVLKLIRFATLLCLTSFADAGEAPSVHLAEDGPLYQADGKLEFPSAYREWVYLSSGFDMSYRLSASPDHHMFGNVFVNPSAYRSFQKTGVWPSKTVLVLEFRGGDGKASLVKGGQYQTGDLMGIEVHVKDDDRFAGNWAFFEFDEQVPAMMVPRSADCYSCHATHGAVDTTFVQFYPTLLEIATTRQTLERSDLTK
jgi:hypothetical protein